jgi:hypothetical protein
MLLMDPSLALGNTQLATYFCSLFTSTQYAICNSNPNSSVFYSWIPSLALGDTQLATYFCSLFISTQYAICNSNPNPAAE